MSMPALQALRARFPSTHIAILAKPWVAGLYGREPFCDELIPYTGPKSWKGWRGKWALVSELRKRQFDCAVLFQNAFEAAALVHLARIPVRIGYARDARSWLLTDAIPVPRPCETPKHQQFYYLELLRRANLISDYPANSTIRLSGARGASPSGPVIGVSPGAAYGGAKRWPAERFAEAAVRIARERGASVAVFGSKAEVPICDAVRERIRSAGVECVNFAGRTELSEFIDLAAACEVYLTNDSGPMHIASALGVPTVAIFGATDDVATGPTGLHSRVVREPVECSPCLLRECPIDHRCMTRVSAVRVADVALELLAVGRNTSK